MKIFNLVSPGPAVKVPRSDDEVDISTSLLADGLLKNRCDAGSSRS